MSQLLYSRKRRRMLKHRRKLRNLYNNTSGFPSGATLIGRGGWWDTEHPLYYKRIYRGSRSKWLKKQSNRRIRHYKHEISSGGNYRRIFDFWWELY